MSKNQNYFLLLKDRNLVETPLDKEGLNSSLDLSYRPILA